MTELKYKVGDKLLVNADIDSFSKGDIVTVEIDDSAVDGAMPYFVSNGTVSDWLYSTELPACSLSTEDEGATPDAIAEAGQKLDLHTVNHIHSHYSNIIQEALEAGKSHEAINVALLGYIEGLQDGLSNA